MNVQEARLKINTARAICEGWAIQEHGPHPESWRKACYDLWKYADKAEYVLERFLDSYSYLDNGIKKYDFCGVLEEELLIEDGDVLEVFELLEE